MHHDTDLINIIAVGLALAFVLGALAHRLRLSPLVGYLLAGVFVGPFTPGFVADQELATQLSELGVMLLMFGVGLHFSLEDLLEVKAIAIPGAIAQIVVATALGWALAWGMGWTPLNGFVFGLALSVASTVVLLRAMEDRRLLETRRGRIAVGWLIVEDIAMVLALVNDTTSPLAALAHYTLPLHVGAEKAVAATKSYLATLSAILQLVSVWSGNTALQQAVLQLPQSLQAAIALPPQLTTDALAQVAHLVVLGRGLGYAIAREIALKLKEVCGIHAEAFSSAEFLHGPVTLVKNQFAIVDVTIEDESLAAHRAQIEDVQGRGAAVVQLHHRGISADARVLPLLLLQRFYLDVEVVARSRGINPDAPPGLNKVTKTL